MSPLCEPTLEEVHKQISKVQENEQFVASERVLTKLFTELPYNTNFDEVLLKVTVLNSLYSTKIYALHNVAQHIVNLKIDARLNNHSIELVPEIARVPIRDGSRNFYSFATKYCNWHQPDTYPIYDSFVDQLLWEYKKTDSFAKFYRQDLLNYSKFCNILLAFRAYYGLEDLTVRELDRFLWSYGKQLS